MAKQGDNMTDVKRANRSAVLRVLHENGAVSRKKLAAYIGLTPAAITKITGEMIEEGLLREGEAVFSGGAGRREILLKTDPFSRFALGIFINKGLAVLSAVNLDGTVIFSENTVLPPNAPANETITTLCNLLLDLSDQNGIPRDKIIGTGLALRGQVSDNGRILKNSFGALNEYNYPIADEVEKLTGLKVISDNNVRSLFSAHLFFSKDKEISSQFFLRCEYGIGAALSVDFRIWHGGSAQCSEIGHIPIIRKGGKPCSCGKSGCLETVASPNAILEDTKAAFSEDNTPLLYKRMIGRSIDEMRLQDVLDSAAGGDSTTASIVGRAVTALAQALKSVIYIIDPEKIVLYGHLFENAYFLDHFIAEMREGVDSGHDVSVEKSRCNLKLEDAAAGLLVIQKFIDEGGL